MFCSRLAASVLTRKLVSIRTIFCNAEGRWNSTRSITSAAFFTDTASVCSAEGWTYYEKHGVEPSLSRWIARVQLKPQRDRYRRDAYTKKRHLTHGEKYPMGHFQQAILISRQEVCRSVVTQVAKGQLILWSVEIAKSKAANPYLEQLSVLRHLQVEYEICKCPLHPWQLLTYATHESARVFSRLSGSRFIGRLRRVWRVKLPVMPTESTLHVYTTNKYSNGES